MNNTPITPLGDTDMAKDSLSQALRNKRLNASNKKRLTPTNDGDDEPGSQDSGPVSG
jgi:hypothetical protein